MDLITLVLTTLASAFAGSYLAGYLKKKGENLATHEDIAKLVEQVSAVTKATKHIEARISNETWRRERRSDLQLRTIESFSTLTSDYIQRSIAAADYMPGMEWFSAFCSVDASVKALFDQDVYASFKAVEVLIGKTYGPGAIVEVAQFVEKRDTSVKMMYERVLDASM
jgi:hypothetical protein